MASIPTHDISKFSWDMTVSPATGELSASDIGIRGCFAPIPDRGPNTIGFNVHSPKTGTTLLFTMIQCLDNGDDIGGWVFKNRDTGIKVTIWNS